MLIYLLLLFTQFCNSIGSLGWDLDEPGVKNVTVRKATFSKTQNGFRIKSWGRPSSGFVEDVHFEHATMSDVQNPIIIDQHYCPFRNGCPSQVSFLPGYLFCFIFLCENFALIQSAIIGPEMNKIGRPN